MLLLPVSHEESLVQRLPWVTLAIILVCTAVQVRASVVEGDSMGQLAELTERRLALEQRAVEAVAVRVMSASDPGEARRRLSQRTAGDVDVDTVQIEPTAVREFLRGAFVEGRLHAADDLFAEYQELGAEAERVAARVPTLALGYAPAGGGIRSMLTSLFAHADWLHLIANMWFLYLVGTSLEDRWGRSGFLIFYLLSGVVAALAYGEVHPGSSQLLVGASGAIAGAMGAFAVCFARSRVRIFYFYMLLFHPRWGTFRASAMALLVLWLISQGLMAWWEASGGGDGVAYSAHAGGALYGLLVGLLMKVSGTDARLQEAHEEASWDDGWREDPRLLEAIALRERGLRERAVTVLMGLLREDPNHQAAREELLSLSLSDDPGNDGDRGSLPPAASRSGSSAPPRSQPPTSDAPPAMRERTRLAGLDKSVPWLLAHDRAQHNATAVRETYRNLRRRCPDYGLTDRELAWVVGAATSLNDVTLAVDATSELLCQFPDSPLLPRALWSVAELQGDSGRAALQRDTLEQIVRRYGQHEVAELAQRALATQPTPPRAP